MQACSSLQVQIISLDLAQRLPFRLKPKVLAPALERGVMFEICYACCLRDETSRRMLFSNAAALARATRGKNIIISSGARTAFELRSPYDAINLSTLFGLPTGQAKVIFAFLQILPSFASCEADCVAQITKMTSAFDLTIGTWRDSCLF